MDKMICANCGKEFPSIYVDNLFTETEEGRLCLDCFTKYFVYKTESEDNNYE